MTKTHYSIYQWIKTWTTYHSCKCNVCNKIRSMTIEYMAKEARYFGGKFK